MTMTTRWRFEVDGVALPTPREVALVGLLFIFLFFALLCYLAERFGAK